MNKTLYKLCTFLKRNSFEKLAESIEYLQREADSIDEDWDIEAEEKMLSSDPQDIDKLIRETSPRKGWSLPDEEPFLESDSLKNEFAWINDDLYQARQISKSFSPELITQEFVTAFKSASDGRQPKYIGAGVYGAVWDVGNNRYLKIYAAGNEELFTKLVRDLVFDQSPYAEHELMIFSSGKFKKPVGPYDYQKNWKFMEKLVGFAALQESDQELAEYFKVFTSEIRSIIAELKYGDEEEALLFNELKRRIRIINKDFSPEFRPNILKEAESIKAISNISKKILKDSLAAKKSRQGLLYIDIMTNSFDLDKKWASKLIAHMVVLALTQRIDTHIHNIGLRPSTGTFVYFDA